MKSAPPAEAYAALVARLSADPRVSVGTGSRRGFGRGALAAGGRIFAMLASGDRMVVKLPRHRVDTLVAQGRGARFEPRPGRPMREWLELSPGTAQTATRLAREALDYVSASP